MLSQLANSAMLRSARCTRCNQVSAAYTRINFCCHQEHSCRGARLVRNADADEVCNTCGLVFGRTMDDREKRMFEDSKTSRVCLVVLGWGTASTVSA